MISLKFCTLLPARSSNSNIIQRSCSIFKAKYCWLKTKVFQRVKKKKKFTHKTNGSVEI